ncbi:MAG: class I SAM-dependent methyltransferase [Actinomycetota bacterium]|nr:class I SAM-dependent methyltransferase [Actinomycetota bacterium]
MVKERIAETDSGIQDELEVEIYDSFLRGMRDRGWLETNLIIETGINRGLSLEIGPGPGYLGLEWLKKTEGTRLKGVEISASMIKLAEKNAEEYGLSARANYVVGDASNMPFSDNTFDSVFTNGSLHEWSQPEKIFNEIYRVLKPQGIYFISDMRRDMNFFVKWFMKAIAKPKEIRSGLVTSINASYTPKEIQSILSGTALKISTISCNPMGIIIKGIKQYKVKM